MQRAWTQIPCARIAAGDTRVGYLAITFFDGDVIADLVHGKSFPEAQECCLASGASPMHRQQDNDQSVRWFLETLAGLRNELSDAEFEVLRMWIRFVAEKDLVAH
jgi:hypothetical protein